ncbi:DUF4044 domain-containing protein [Candidatus Bathyarchaeota archaeon]|nr:MAG: DUF4044 domain-containing protein [Candidatus Bathyarchaeota archaeon]
MKIMRITVFSTGFEYFCIIFGIIMVVFTVLY